MLGRLQHYEKKVLKFNKKVIVMAVLQPHGELICYLETPSMGPRYELWDGLSWKTVDGVVFLWHNSVRNKTHHFNLVAYHWWYICNHLCFLSIPSHKQNKITLVSVSSFSSRNQQLNGWVTVLNHVPLLWKTTFWRRRMLWNCWLNIAVMFYLSSLYFCVLSQREKDGNQRDPQRGCKWTPLMFVVISLS